MPALFQADCNRATPIVKIMVLYTALFSEIEPSCDLSGREISWPPKEVIVLLHTSDNGVTSGVELSETTNSNIRMACWNACSQSR